MAVETANLNGLSQAGAPVIDSRIDQQADDERAGGDQHQRSHRRQRRAGLPQAAEQRGGCSFRSRPGRAKG